jgi:CHAD domain-containing protein
MDYAFRAGESLEAATRRVATTCLDEALALLGDDSPASVHEARKRLKQTRALLRLVRDGVDDADFRVRNHQLRGVGRALSDRRDADVLVDAVDGLRALDAVGPAAFEGLRQALEAERAAAVIEDPAEQARGVEDARDWFASLTLDVERVDRGLRRIYADGRSAAKAAARDGSDEALHEWRKRVKDLWYAIRLLEGAWPGPLGALREELHTLSDGLGTDHDLAELAAAGDRLADAFASPADAATFRDVVAQRRAALQGPAFDLGRRVYAEKPKAFAGRVSTYQDRWRAEAGRAAG